MKILFADIILDSAKTLKKKYSFLVIVFISFSSLFAQPFAGGDGTIGNPYKISTPEQLDSVRNYLDKSFILINDIDLNVIPYNTGNGWTPIGTNSIVFEGDFNGAGYLIKNLYMTGVGNMGLFYSANHLASIHNLGIVNCDVSGFWGGGLIYLSDASIYKCYVTGKVSGESCSGGVVGFNYGSIANCYSTCNVNGSLYVGGIAGSLSEGGACITQCYASGNIGGSGSRGGLVGYVGYGNVTRCYFDSITTGQNKGAGAVSTSAYASIHALSTIQLRQQSNLDSLDFTNTWIMREDSTYPGLQGINNAPFAFNDTINYNDTISKSTLLVNDFDIETKQEALVLKIIELLGANNYYSTNWLDFPTGFVVDSLFEVKYRIGEILEPGDTIWGNSARVIINYPPVIISIAPDTAEEDMAYIYQVNATDANNDSLMYSIVNQPSGMQIVDTIISWIPREGILSSGEVILIVSDGFLADTQYFSIVVNPVNDAPRIISTAPSAVDSGEVYIYIINATDAEKDELTFTISGEPSGMTIDSNVISWTPDAGIINSGEVTLTVSDGKLSDTEIFTVIVLPPTYVLMKENVVKWLIYPNPARGYINIECTGSNPFKGYELRLVGIHGIEILSTFISVRIHNIDVSNYLRGVYFLQIIDDTGQMIEVKKIILE